MNTPGYLDTLRKYAARYERNERNERREKPEGLISSNSFISYGEESHNGGVTPVMEEARAAPTGEGSEVTEPPMCRYPEHRPSDWRHPSGGGPVICGVCHPPPFGARETAIRPKAR